MRGPFCVAALLCACVLAVGSSTAVLAKKKAPPPPPLSSWPQSHSDIPADPDVTFGILPNGMRYLIKKNTTPAHQVAIRLRLAAGSLDETDNEEGVAHFLEHMAFRGSKHMADGEIMKTLESLGAAKGADTNAFTFADSTVFAFDLPVNDDAALDKSLTLTREIASEELLDPKAIDSERAVVLAETRQRDVAAVHASKAYLTGLLGARVAEALMPIGKTEILQGAQAPLLRKFYSAHYRSELAVLAIVGDIEPGAIEAKIKAHFSNWKPAAPAVKRPVYTVKFASGLSTATFSEPGAGTMITLSWVGPHDATPDTIAKEQRNIVRNIALTVLNQRLADLTQSANPPFLVAGAEHNEFNVFADSTDLTLSYTPGHALDSLRAARDAYADMLRNGVRQDEVDRVLANMRGTYQVSIAAAKTLPSAGWAGAYMAAQGTNSVIESPQESQVLFEGAVKDLHAEQVTAVLRTLLAGDPKVFISGPAPIDGVEKNVAAIFAQPQSTAPAAQTAPAAVWPYTSFGPPGTVTSQKTIDDLGTTFIQFTNGVRLTVKPTKFLDGQVFIHVQFGDGRLAFSKKRKSPSWALNSFMGGGLKRIAMADMAKALAGKEINVNFVVWDTSYQFNGMTRPADFETEMQYMAAYITDPAWRPEALRNVQSAALGALPQMAATADGVFGFQFWTVAHDNDQRWLQPTADDIRSTRLEDVKALMKDALADGPIEVVVTGDISVTDAIKGLQTTFGALPKRRVLTAPPVGDERQPSPKESPIVLRYQGAGDQSVATIAWPTTSVFPDVQRQRTQQVLVNILSQRLFEELRTQEGMTYTPGTQIAGSMVTPGYGFVSVFANIPASRIAGFYAAVDKTVADLKAKEVSAEELERARGPLVHGLEQAQHNNDYWVSGLADTQIDSRRLDLIRSNLGDLKKVTAADVQREIQTYLQNDKAWKFLVVPQDYVLTSGK